MNNTFTIRVGDIELHLWREGNDIVAVRLGWITERLSVEQVQELRNDLDTVLKEMFPE